MELSNLIQGKLWYSNDEKKLNSNNFMFTGYG